MTWSAAYVLAGLVLTLWLARLWTRRRLSGERASRPRELVHAELVHKEELFRIQEPIRLVVKVDRVYRLPTGSLVLVELKTRDQDRTYLSDIIQLSAQRLAIEIQTDAMVEPYAFVSVVGLSGKMRSHQVWLLDAATVVDLYRRREAILTRRVSPAYASSKSACCFCALRSRCDRFGR
nr:hypothetical protein [Delftia acidovorans]